MATLTTTCRPACGTAAATPKAGEAQEAHVPSSAATALPGSICAVQATAAASTKVSIFTEEPVTEATEGLEETENGKITPKTPS